VQVPLKSPQVCGLFYGKKITYMNDILLHTSTYTNINNCYGRN
jgi:hypothetical protein